MADEVPAAPVAPAPVTPPPAETPAKAPEAPKPPAESRVAAEAARKERAVQADKAAWKKQRDAEQAAWAARLEKAERIEKATEEAKADPRKALALLEAIGVDYDTLTKVKMGENPADLAVKALEKKLADIEAGNAKKEADAKKAAEEASKAAERETLQAWHRKTAEYVTANAEKYELVVALGYQAEVGKMIEEHFEATQKATGVGVEVSVDDAAAKLEAYLQEEKDPAVTETFKRFTATKWFKSRYAPVAKAETPAEPPKRSRDTEVPEKKIVESAAPTITNKFVASSNAKTAAAKSREALRELARKQLGS